MKLTSLIALATLLLCATVQAGEPAGLNIRNKGRIYPATLLPETQGFKGSMDEFAAVIGDQLRAYTKESNFESCASICRAPDNSLGASPISIGAHMACPIVKLCPTGYEPTGENIHTHARRGPYKVNRADAIVLGPLAIGDMEERAEPNLFSEEDLASGSTYLAAPKALWHRERTGKGVRDVREVVVAPAATASSETFTAQK